MRGANAAPAITSQQSFKVFVTNGCGAAWSSEAVVSVTTVAAPPPAPSRRPIGGASVELKAIRPLGSPSFFSSHDQTLHDVAIASVLSFLGAEVLPPAVDRTDVARWGCTFVLLFASPSSTRCSGAGRSKV